MRKSHSSKEETQGASVAELKSAKINQRAPYRHARKGGIQMFFDFPGFRVALPPEADQPQAEAESLA
jgi:hypothetical protein